MEVSVYEVNEGFYVHFWNQCRKYLRIYQYLQREKCGGTLPSNTSDNYLRILLENKFRIKSCEFF